MGDTKAYDILCVCVRVCVSVYVCERVYMCVSVCEYMWECVSVYVSEFESVWLYVCVCECVCECIVCVCVCVYPTFINKLINSTSLCLRSPDCEQWLWIITSSVICSDSIISLYSRNSSSGRLREEMERVPRHQKSNSQKPVQTVLSGPWFKWGATSGFRDTSRRESNSGSISSRT